MDRTEVNASPVQKAPQGIKKYKYVLLTALLGVLLLLLPKPRLGRLLLLPKPRLLLLPKPRLLLLPKPPLLFPKPPF